MIDYKNDTFYKKKEESLGKVFKYIKWTINISIIVFLIYIFVSSSTKSKKLIFENAFQGEVRSFVIKEKGRNWMYVDGGKFTYDFIAFKNTTIKVGDSLFKSANSNDVFIKRKGKLDKELLENETLTLLQIDEHN